MLEEKEINQLKVFATKIRLGIMRQFKARGFGHLGGSMSIADVLAVLYGKCMRIDPKNPADPSRDFLVLSKGHAGPALYAALALKGYFKEELLNTLNQNGTTLPSHCDRQKTPGVDMTTGSLGQGFSSAVGIALGNRHKGIDNYTYLIVGDGESDEGQVWEGVMFSAQYKLSHLIAFIDCNKQQLDGFTKDIMNLGSMKKKYEDFGWFAQEVDGHDVDAVYEAIQKGKAQSDKPVAIILDTVKGKGIPFAEGSPSNHHMDLKPEQTAEGIEVLTKLLKEQEAAV